ncbi:hypothetical protein DLJ58_03580 [Micromonospora arida]|uniref:Uncharacterized protein n=2 Tax=Micromonospora arida TaxID=2203715 RepID=A0A3N9XKL1_9ACTN|nr:hypothetical protein DLJ58_03580 [Micromonospora arida]
MGSTWSMTLRLSLMWISTVLLLALVAHGLRVEYLPIEALTGIDQTAITAGDFEWQAEHVAPVAVVLTIASSLFIAVPARALFGAWQASPQCRLVRTDP